MVLISIFIKEFTIIKTSQCLKKIITKLHLFELSLKKIDISFIQKNIYRNITTDHFILRHIE